MLVPLPCLFLFISKYDTTGELIFSKNLRGIFGERKSLINAYAIS